MTSQSGNLDLLRRTRSGLTVLGSLHEVFSVMTYEPLARVAHEAAPEPPEALKPSYFGM